MMNESGGGASEERPRLTPVDVQQVQFRRSRIRGGYSEQEVDDFLDRVTETIAAFMEENDRLREQIRRTPTSQVSGAGEAAEASRVAAALKEKAQREADAIVREAHARAQALVRDAQGRGGDPGGAGRTDATAIAPFINREREFLQELARVIQGHAETVKQMVNDARAAQAEAPTRPRAPAHEPFGPGGDSAGRDIEGMDDAHAATAGTAEADSVVGAQPDDDGPSVTPASVEIPEVQGGTPPAGDGGPAPQGEAVGTGAAALIEVPDADGVPGAVTQAPDTSESDEGPDLPRLPTPPRLGEQGGGGLDFEESAATRATSQATADDDSDEARELRELREREASLRELFWGED